MDFATLIGLLAGMGIIAVAVTSGSDAGMFVNMPGLAIVLGGTVAATLIKFPIGECAKSFALAVKTAFVDKHQKPGNLIREANELANIARKRGMVALEDHELDDAFFRKGVQLCADGHPREFIEKVLGHDIEMSIERFEVGEKIFRAIGDAAPAFGLIGTLVGLVQMLGNMQEPDKLGPAMAVALLTTLYGAVIANLVALPIADKLENRSAVERTTRRLIIDSVLSIKDGLNPLVMDELLQTYVPANEREKVLQDVEHRIEAQRGKEARGVE